MSKKQKKNRQTISYPALTHWIVIDKANSIVGLFSTVDKAVLACKEPTDFVGPLVVDQSLAGITFASWVGGFFPLRESPMGTAPVNLDDARLGAELSP